MAKGSPILRAWNDAFKPSCRSRGMRFVTATGFVLDKVYLTELFYPQVFHPDKDPDRLRITWTVDIKPLAVDEILWAAFMPDEVMGPQKRINRRVNGAFKVQPLRIGSGHRDVPATDDPDWDPVLDEFDRIRAEFITMHPTANDYAAVVEQHPDGIAPNRALTRTVTALIAAGRNADAARMADDAVARGERGGMSSTVDVLKYLAAYAKGPEAYAAFTASLTPTHDYQVLCETQRTISSDLIREHHPGIIGHHLRSMNGSDPWAIVLSARPPTGVPADFSTSLYLQAAGTADAIQIEFCRPGGADIGAVSVRSVVGHPHTGPAELDVDIVLPRSVQTISRHEVFTAEEAAEMFERFYRTDTIGDGYVLRPVEGYTADGGYIDLR
ncbi:hypothetical protein MMAG44476_20332 [Mycolicibacterium mageritense DSM 44476 = CIP 104973]|uniref:Uncharacterized protein n=2 Tax=Mycolicibacterium mageritense TaxID=53462 RepID=A0AAI8XLS9_MYCME|nr:hypothetical protein hbim_01034 [Mycolicibacterium mageritense]CDO23488.1 hypothetical protein BN978_03975 [Mycolicibacterium mageritense DSM 44476 = CIP 104973]